MVEYITFEQTKIQETIVTKINTDKSQEYNFELKKSQNYM